MLFALTLSAALLGTPDAAAPPSARAELTGAATPVLASLCVPASPGAAGEEPVLRCAALPGVDLFLRGAEDARSVALGQPNGFIPAPPLPMRLASTVRWRLLGGRPMAAILRYALPQTPDEALLAVVKAPRGEAPGCLVAILAGRAGAQNEEADRWADEHAPGFRCGIDRPEFVGSRADEAVVRAGRAWVGAP